jgi:hypothetical protein
MTYLNLIPALLVIAAYFLGRHVGKHSRDAEVEKLGDKNYALATMLDFTKAENEHVSGLLKEKVATAHAPVPPPRTDPITEWPLRGHWNSEWPTAQARLAKNLKWCEGHRRYDLCHLP